MTPAEFDTWYCTPYISAIALQISEELKGTDVRVIRRVAEGEGNILTRVRTLLWLVTFAALLAAALAVGASAAASVIERAHGDWAHEGAGCELGTCWGAAGRRTVAAGVCGRRNRVRTGHCIGALAWRADFGFAPAPKLFVLLIILG